MMIAGISVGFSDGRVTCLNCCQRSAPSMVAASYRSAGIDCSAPRVITIMKGKLSQPLVISPVMNDEKTPSNQAMGAPPNICMA